jgi:hypothetical protein
MQLGYVMYERVTSKYHEVSNAICYRALRLALARKSSKWRPPWIYTQFPQDHLTVTFQYTR